MKKLSYFTIGWGLAFILLTGQGQAQTALTIFPEVQRSKINTSGVEQYSNTSLISGLLVSDNQRLDLLLEAVASMHHGEHGSTSSNETDLHLERLQLGWNIDEQKTLWIGRHHSPVGYVNNEYHHGSYLSTSLGRPIAAKIAPRHVTGLLFTAEQHANTSSYQIDLSMGLAPAFIGHAMQDFDPLDAQSGHDYAFTAKLSLKPDSIENTVYGASIHYSNIAYLHENSKGLRQNIFNAFINWEDSQNRLTSEAYYIDARSQSVAHGSYTDDAFAAYIQYERTLRPELSVYARYAKGSKAESNDLLKMYSFYAKENKVAGIRFNTLKHHALTVEVSQRSSDSNSYTLQWSAALQ